MKYRNRSAGRRGRRWETRPKLEPTKSWHKLKTAVTFQRVTLCNRSMPDLRGSCVIRGLSSFNDDK